MSDKNVLWGVVAGTILGAVGASLIQRGSLRPHTTKILSYGYDIKDMLVEKAETLKKIVRIWRQKRKSSTKTVKSRRINPIPLTLKSSIKSRFLRPQ